MSDSVLCSSGDIHGETATDVTFKKKFPSSWPPACTKATSFQSHLCESGSVHKSGSGCEWFWFSSWILEGAWSIPECDLLSLATCHAFVESVCLAWDETHATSLEIRAQHTLKTTCSSHRLMQPVSCTIASYWPVEGCPSLKGLPIEGGACAERAPLPPCTPFYVRLPLCSLHVLSLKNYPLFLQQWGDLQGLKKITHCTRDLWILYATSQIW